MTPGIDPEEPRLGPNEKGAIAEAAITLAAIEAGIRVLKPAAEHQPYDLAFDYAGEIQRIQCKWARLRADVIEIQVGRCRATPSGYVRATYERSEIDALAAYCADLRRVYLIPVAVVAGVGLLRLRLRQPKNGQRAAIRWAVEYGLGAVAQLGERRHGMAEVRGSSPLSSTDDASSTTTSVGAHRFSQSLRPLHGAGRGRGGDLGDPTRSSDRPSGACRERARPRSRWAC